MPIPVAFASAFEGEIAQKCMHAVHSGVTPTCELVVMRTLMR